MAASVSAVVKWVEIPTYVMGPDSPYPVFHWRAWRGHYPFSTQLDLSTESAPVKHRIVVLENDYLRAEVLPDMGGRLYRLFDKLAGQETFMVPPSVKFQNIAIRGAWIAGGIEFNFGYRSHTAVTCSPVSWAIRKDADGGASVWVGSVIRPMESRWSLRIGLKPDRAAMDLEIFTMGPMALPGMMYWWTNASVEVSHESKFYYYGQYAGDWSPHSWPWTDGADFRWWKNRTFGSDMFLMEPQRDYLGFYDFSRRHGLAQTADRFHSPGQKYFTWGADQRGRFWDLLLSDTEQAYCEIQRGRLPSQGRTEPLPPMAIETWTETWIPIHDTHGFSGTAGDLVIAVDEHDPNTLRLMSTEPRKALRVELFSEDGPIGEWRIARMTPGKVLTRRMDLPAGKTLRRAVATDAGGHVVMDWREFDFSQDDWHKRSPHFDESKAGPEELFAEAERRRFALWPNGTESAEALYAKVLAADPGHSGALGALAEIDYYAGRFAEADEKALRALARRPMDPAMLTLRGWILVAQGRPAEAIEPFSVATRYEPGRRNGLVGLLWAYLATGDLPAAERTGEQLRRLCPADRWGRWLRAMVLRKTARAKEAAEIVRGLLADDPLWYRANAEAVLLGVPTDLAAGQRKIADESVVAATDYLLLGFWSDAIEILKHEDSDEPFSPAVRLAHLAYAHHKAGDRTAVRAALRQLAKCPTAQANPWTIASVAVLTELAEAYPDQAMIHFLLGNVLASRRRVDEAVAAWRKAVRAGLDDTVVRTNLAAAAAHTGDDKTALRHYRKAWKLSGAKGTPGRGTSRPGDPNLYLFSEMDKFLARCGRHAERERLYRQLPESARRRSIVALRRVPQLLDLQRYDQALEELTIRTFLSGEAHERVVRGQFIEAVVAKAVRLMDRGRMEQAIETLKLGLTYPRNHNAGRRAYQPEEAVINYYLGLAHEIAGDVEAAQRFWTLAAQEQHYEGDLTQAYEMMAWTAMGHRARAMSLAHDFEQFARGESSPRSWIAHFHGPSMAKINHGLAQLAKGWPDQARSLWAEALTIEPDARWLRLHVNLPAWLVDRMARKVTGPKKR